MAKKSGKTESDYDLIIIGGGIAGLSAAMYGARLGLRSLCLGASSGSEIPIGGTITTTNLVENYPGIAKITGEEFGKNFREHAEAYELATIKEERAEDVSKKGEKFSVKTENNDYTAKTILFATGTVWRKLDVPGSKEFENKGVAYCALCDAPLFKNKVVGVVGGSDSAVKYAAILADYAKKVYIIYRGENVRAEAANLKKIENNKKIEIINKANITKIKGDKVMRSVDLDREFNGSKELQLDGVFIAIGLIPISGLAKKLKVKLNEKGEIVINHKTCETNLEGVYAAGDVTDGIFKQAISSADEGCKAAFSAYEYLSKK